MKADLSLMMVAAGTRGELVSPGADGGPGLALESDAMFVRTESDASSGAGGNLAAAKADVSRLRLALDGSWGLALAGGAALTPSLELGLRRDGGDAETGFGVDSGGGLAFADPTRGVAFDVSARTLIAHEASGFEERGLSARLAFDPEPSSERGLSLAHAQPWGPVLGRRGRALGPRDPGRTRGDRDGRGRSARRGGGLRAAGIRRAFHRHAVSGIRHSFERQRVPPRLAPLSRFVRRLRPG